MISEKDLERIQRRKQLEDQQQRQPVVMNAQNEAEYESYIDMIEKVLGKQSNPSPQQDSEEFKTLAETGVNMEDQDGVESLDTIL